METRDDIGELFKDAFKEHSTQVEKEEWIKLDIELDKMKFYKFSFFHFNIFYSCMIMTSMLFTAVCLIDYFFLSRNIEKNILNFDNESRKHPQKNDSLQNSKIINYKNHIGEDLLTSPVKKNQKNAAEKSVDKIFSGITKVDKIDIKTLPETLAQKKSNVVMPALKMDQKKPVYIIKRDTIIVFDTIINEVKKRKNR